MASTPAQSTIADVDGDTPMRSEDESSNSGSSSEGEEEQTEWLVTTREKRSTAGNRLSSLIQQAATEDDELELLFAEDEDDVGFEDVEGDASDVQMDSSDDDDDQGPTIGMEELEGEKELQQQARAERQAKKRKANDGIPKVFRKKVKIDPTAPKAPPPRPKKKSERASWIPTAEEAPTRASARSTTKISKEQLHAQMLDREKRRLKQLEIMEKAAKRKEAEKPKETTQEDRLAEAARVEKKNAKSLNRWEEAEKIREEEQRAKLAALHSRKMEGPFITWWSGMAEWVGGKLKRVGKHVARDEKHRGAGAKKRKADELEESNSRPSSVAASRPAAAVTNSTPLHAPALSLGGVSMAEAPSQIRPPILELASVTPVQSQLVAQIEIPMRNSHSLSASDPPSGNAATPIASVPPTPVILDGSAPLPGFYNSPHNPPPPPGPQSLPPPPPRMMPSQTTPFVFAPIQSVPLVERPPVIEYGTWNCLILENFNENAIKLKDVQCQVLFNRKFPKTQKPPHPVLCAITSYPAKFRDPSTNLPYCSSYAYKEIQKLKRGEYKWSSLLHAYVGQSQYAARGVPARFIKPVPPVSEPRPGLPHASRQ